MTHAKLYSISAIAKLLDLPESTLHYWKNRFEPFLPSVGQGRGKRFPAEAVEVFRAIGALLESGLSVADAKDELAGPPTPRRPQANAPQRPSPPRTSRAPRARSWPCASALPWPRPWP